MKKTNSRRSRTSFRVNPIEVLGFVMVGSAAAAEAGVFAAVWLAWGDMGTLWFEASVGVL